MAQLASALQSRGVHPSQAVVLLPYAQLIQQARQAWAAHVGETSFLPRFESTLNWADSLGGSHGVFVPAPDDLRLDMALDVLTAASLLERSGLASHRDMLTSRVVEAAWSVAGVAAAVPPTDRSAWGTRLAGALGADLDTPALALEAAVARIALAWAANSAYPTDRLFEANPVLLVVMEGFQRDPLAQALQARWPDCTLTIALAESPAPADATGPSSYAVLHAAQDAEDEAEQAAACVLQHLTQGRSPVALIAQDRQLTRRVGAMLAGRGIAMRDETGWKLSTTRAAATVMGLLRAMPWDASTDAVLDWLKNTPALEAARVTTVEACLRRLGVRSWRELPDAVGSEQVSAGRETLALLLQQVEPLRSDWARPRPLCLWLERLRAALQAAGQWDLLATDGAGQTVLEVLRLHEGVDHELDGERAPRMALHEFTHWVNQSLEAGKFSPPHPPAEQVVILPLAQLLGRSMAAVVLPGCDELRLPVSPEPSGPWTPAQRVLLGLPSRDALAATASQAWQHALQQPQVDVLWRASEAGEHLLPSGFVQTLLLNRKGLPPAETADPRSPREVQITPTLRPLPTGEALTPTRLSASAYEDLRRCPYRFFALRQLQLQESDELDNALGKRDFGNWLHGLLKDFHDALKAAPTDDAGERVALIDAAAERSRRELALGASEFLPYAAAWPGVRDGYLQWLREHEAAGAVYEAGEVWREIPLGTLSLRGQLDRVDRMADGQALVMDYKTENSTTTAERIKSAEEDTQLAFYAALLEDDTLSAAYVNLGEKGVTKTYQQPAIVELRDGLIDSIRRDMARIAEGAALPALGEGTACDWCAARGLCRKDFWKS
ncbi:PD-(D/E)XK nuclease family protein [Polaromonas sp. YR568]|uniref:PD-(D/E)XK nuclease family protein n=1 Tax=Polaromonas sp. YR568 TaxID=1855301 RepID=UPI0031381CAE